MEDAEKELVSACSLALARFHRHQELCRQFIAIRDTLLVVAKDCHLYDFPGVECNGFRYAVQTGIILMKTASTHQIHLKDEPHEDLVKLVSLVYCGLKYFKRMYIETTKLPLNQNGSRPIMFKDYQLVTETFQAFLDTNAMDVLYQSLAGFHLPKPEGLLLRLGLHILAPILIAPNIWTGISTLFDYELKKQIMRKAFRSFKIEYVKIIDYVTDSYWVRKIGPLITASFFHPKVCRTIYVPQQTQIKIQCTVNPEQKVQLIRVPAVPKKNSKIRCRLLMEYPEGRKAEVSVVIKNE